MNSPLISVLVLTYHPKKEELFSTLRSVALQKDCDFEVIVADDGSADFFESEIRQFLDAHQIPHTLVPHAQNQGTVRNILDGVRAARGRFIKPISPGDLLYDDTTLRDIAAFMQQHQAKIAFGNLLFYSCEPAFTVKKLTYPCLTRLYRADRRYSYPKAMKHQMVYNDFISGASAVYEKDAFAEALETVSPAVRYAEDTVFQLFAARNVRIYWMNRFLVWYEHGSGISTKKSTGFTRVEEDFYKFYPLLSRLFPKNPYAKRACRIWETRKNGTRAQQLALKLLPDSFLFSLQVRLRKKRLHIAGYSEDFFRQCQL